MIEQALVLLKNELSSFIHTRDSSVNVDVDNIALFETANGDTLNNSVIITLVNIEEESTLKNQPSLKRPFTNTATYRNPPVFLNLYVLITCNYSGKAYELALQRLSLVVQFFQSRNIFSTASSVTAGSMNLDDTDSLSLKFTMELYTLTFEQINHLWGSLGGRQIPFAMYKLRLVAIDDHAVLREVPLIEEIESNMNSTIR